jgi:hypothetical protein
VPLRADFKSRQQWVNAQPKSIPVGCPCGCAIEYDLLAAEKASLSDVDAWIGTLLERQHPNHEGIIFFCLKNFVLRSK